MTTLFPPTVRSVLTEALAIVDDPTRLAGVLQPYPSMTPGTIRAMWPSIVGIAGAEINASDGAVFAAMDLIDQPFETTDDLRAALVAAMEKLQC